MARSLRVQYEGAIYHVTIRGNGRQVIFRDDKDRTRFVEQLGDRVEEYGVRLYLFVMMSNHVHLVLETPGGNLSRFMHSIQTAYTVYYNRRHNRAGHLMQGRYGAKLVEKDVYLSKLSRYVHLNPVCAGSAKTMSLKEKIGYVRRYPWSSYPGYIDESKKQAFVKCEPVLSMMKVKKSEQRRQYRMYVETGLAERDEDLDEALSESTLSIGSEGFRQEIVGRHTALVKRHNKKEDISFRRTTRWLSTEKILGVVSAQLGVDRKTILRRQRGLSARPIAARMLCAYGGITQREAAGVLHLNTGAAVGMQLKKLKRILSDDQHMRRQLERIEQVLTEMSSMSRSTG